MVVFDEEKRGETDRRHREEKDVKRSITAHETRIDSLNSLSFSID
jgi:hypothetical protein